MALLTLFRCLTGESYNGLMHDALVSEAAHPGRCSEAEGTCGHWFAIPYHVSFQVGVPLTRTQTLTLTRTQP